MITTILPPSEQLSSRGFKKKKPESKRARKRRLRETSSRRTSPPNPFGGQWTRLGVLSESPLSMRNLESIPRPPKRIRTPRQVSFSLPPSSFSLEALPSAESAMTAPEFSGPSSSQIAPTLYTLPLLEIATKSSRRWQAVMIARMREKDLGRRLSLQERNALAVERGLGSGRSLERFLEMVDSGGSLDPIKPTGRNPQVLSQVNDFMMTNAASFRYHFSHAVMAEACREATGVGSESTVARVLNTKELGWRKQKQRIIPSLTEENKEQRVSFSRQWLCQTASDSPSAPNQQNTMFWRVHLDEKWFYLHPKGTLLYIPPGVSPPRSEGQE